MKPRHNPFLRTIAIALAFTASANAEILSFDGNQATGVATHTINASDWADYVGGSTTFNSANDWGRLYWRGSAGDGQFIHFDLSSLTGLTLVSPATVTLQNGNATWGGGVDGSFVATANSPWTAGAGQPVPGATAITNAVNATGSYGNGSAVSWSIGSGAFQNIVDNQGSFNGLAVIGGSGSQLHFSGPMNPYLTVKTGSVSSAAGVITADTGSSTWNASNYNFVASSAYSPVLNTLTINGELAGGTSGAGTMTINNGGTVAVNQAGNTNFYWALDGTTVNAGGKLTINGHSNIHNLTLAGGELASTGTDATWGSWALPDSTTVTGGVTSTISAQQVSLSGGVFNVDSGSTLDFTGSTRGSGSLTKNGVGTMKISAYQNYTGGTTVNAGTLEVAGQNSGSGWLRGAVTVNAGGTLLFTGGDGTGFGWNSPVSSLTINGGTFNAAGGAHVGFGSNMPVSLNNGGTISGTGQWNGDGGVGFSSSGDITNTINGSWVLRADGGANHTFNVADGAAAVDLLVSANLGDQWPEVNWVPASNLVKTGTGTMVLAGENSYNGATIVSAGKLIVNGNISTSNTTVQAGATMGGSGTVGAATVQTDGIFAPGNSTGTITFTGDLTLNSGSISDFEINSFSIANYDMAVAAAAGTQNVSFNGILNLLFQSGFNTTGSIKIFDFDGYSGAFTSVAPTGLASGYTASFDNATGIVTVVPEPSAAMLGGLGVLCLLRRRRA